jgi:hypothetical protein
MKRFFTLILMLIYITASSGVVLNVHYCMGKVSSVKVDNFSDEVCKCGAAAAEMSCCFSEFKVVKLEDAHKAVVVAPHIEMPVANLPVSLSLIDIAKTLPATEQRRVIHHPPLTSTLDIYIKNGVFRI